MKLVNTNKIDDDKDKKVYKTVYDNETNYYYTYKKETFLLATIKNDSIKDYTTIEEKQALRNLLVETKDTKVFEELLSFFEDISKGQKGKKYIPGFSNQTNVDVKIPINDIVLECFYEDRLIENIQNVKITKKITFEGEIEIRKYILSDETMNYSLGEIIIKPLKINENMTSTISNIHLGLSLGTIIFTIVNLTSDEETRENGIECLNYSSMGNWVKSQDNKDKKNERR